MAKNKVHVEDCQCKRCGYERDVSHLRLITNAMDGISASLQVLDTVYKGIRLRYAASGEEEARMLRIPRKRPMNLSPIERKRRSDNLKAILKRKRELKEKKFVLKPGDNIVRVLPEKEKCSQERLDEDGICRTCGADRRGI